MRRELPKRVYYRPSNWEAGGGAKVTPSEWVWQRWIGLGVFVLLVFVGIAVVVQALFRPVNGAGMMGGAGMMFPFFGFGWGILGLLFFLWFFAWIFRFAMWPRPFGHAASWGWDRFDAADILRMRYARGEIAKDQFDAMMRDIGK